MADLQKQRDFFESNQEELFKKYAGKAVLISEDFDTFSFDSLEEGYRYGVAHYGYGNFLLTECKRRAQDVQIISPIITIL